jgi:hypothetical protein
MCIDAASCADDFDKERQGLIEALERCAVQQADVHQLEWENRKRAEEIRDLQKVCGVGWGAPVQDSMYERQCKHPPAHQPVPALIDK